MEKHDSEDIRDVVENWIRQQEQTLERLVKQRAALNEEIERLGRSLEDVRPFALSLSIEMGNSDHIPVQPVQRYRKQSRSLPRKTEFAKYSLPEAVEKILRDNPNRDIHADEFVERIFEISSVAQFRSAKGSVVPSLSAGVADGKWQRVAPNTFRLEISGREQDAVNIPTPP